MEMYKLKEIALDFQSNIVEGFRQDGMQLLCIPTYIVPKEIVDGYVLALDWGGTLFRAAIVVFSNKKPVVQEVREILLSAKEITGFCQSDLFAKMSALIGELKDIEKVSRIGYCFSYPTIAESSGDATIIKFNKGIFMPDMIGRLVGESLLTYLKNSSIIKDQSINVIKVVNDTVASLFSGLSQTGFDAYIGLIVGTGTNMACLINRSKIEKLQTVESGLIPVNLEAGNYHPQHLTIYDEMVDINSDNGGQQRYEKAVSGMYLGRILQSVYPLLEFEEKCDGKMINTMLNYPDVYKDECVQSAGWIYQRSAQLVSATLTGLILTLLSHDQTIKNILLAAEGSLFWSHNRNGKDYSEMVLKNVHHLLCDFGYTDINVELYSIQNANLIGAAIAAMS